jgi:hypothetical protein
VREGEEERRVWISDGRRARASWGVVLGDGREEEGVIGGRLAKDVKGRV